MYQALHRPETIQGCSISQTIRNFIKIIKLFIELSLYTAWPCRVIIRINESQLFKLISSFIVKILFIIFKIWVVEIGMVIIYSRERAERNQSSLPRTEYLYPGLSDGPVVGVASGVAHFLWSQRLTKRRLPLVVDTAGSRLEGTEVGGWGNGGCGCGWCIDGWCARVVE